jgi:hypothetical protein
MNTDKIEFIRQVLESIKESRELAKVYDDVGLDIDSKLALPYSTLLDNLVTSLDDYIDSSSGLAWVSYFIYDCEFGEQPLVVNSNNKKYLFNSIDSFIAFLIEEYETPGKRVEEIYSEIRTAEKVVRYYSTEHKYASMVDFVLSASNLDKVFPNASGVWEDLRIMANTLDSIEDGDISVYVYEVAGKYRLLLAPTNESLDVYDALVEEEVASDSVKHSEVKFLGELSDFPWETVYDKLDI